MLLFGMTRALFTLVLVLALAGGAAARSNAAGGSADVADLEAAILDEVNAARAAHGLRPLVTSRGLKAAARAHSRAMLASGAFRHDSADGTAFSERIRRFYPSRGFDSWSVGENLLFSTDELAAAGAVAAWLDSSSHRRNMLSPAWRDVGVGVWRAAAAPGDFGGANASVITVDFGSRRR
jgi:uncharacterized protein YkwD